MDGLHPYFTSGLRWRTRLDEALREAKSGGKKVLVVHGQRQCSGTRALVERTLAKEEVEEMVVRHFVALASDGEAVEPAVAQLLAGLPRVTPTPVCVYLSADGAVLASTAGGRPPAVLLNDLLGAISKR
jgi:hypothetical protein